MQPAMVHHQEQPLIGQTNNAGFLRHTEQRLLIMRHRSACDAGDQVVLMSDTAGSSSIFSKRQNSMTVSLRHDEVRAACARALLTQRLTP